MRALLDINVLIALLDASHVHHQIAALWFAQHGSTGWASCPLTQNSVMRIMGNHRYANPQPLDAVRTRVKAMCATAAHVFWCDDFSILDPTVFDHTTLLKSQHLTDIYLLALAIKHNGRFVTFDGAISTNAVIGCKTQHLVKL